MSENTLDTNALLEQLTSRGINPTARATVQSQKRTFLERARRWAELTGQADSDAYARNALSAINNNPNSNLEYVNGVLLRTTGHLGTLHTVFIERERVRGVTGEAAETNWLAYSRDNNLISITGPNYENVDRLVGRTNGIRNDTTNLTNLNQAIRGWGGRLNLTPDQTNSLVENWGSHASYTATANVGNLADQWNRENRAIETYMTRLTRLSGSEADARRLWDYQVAHVPNSVPARLVAEAQQRARGETAATPVTIAQINTATLSLNEVSVDRMDRAALHTEIRDLRAQQQNPPAATPAQNVAQPQAQGSPAVPQMPLADVAVPAPENRPWPAAMNEGSRTPPVDTCLVKIAFRTCGNEQVGQGRRPLNLLYRSPRLLRRWQK